MPPKLATTNDSNSNRNNNSRTNPIEQPTQQHEHHKTKKSDLQNHRFAIEAFAESVHLIQGFADTLDAIPPSLTRSLSDLKELDAVLSTPLNQLNTTLVQLINSLKHPQSLEPSQRLQLLRNMMSDIESYRLGAQDKIRVANGTCESLSHHIRQLDTTTSLLISSLPPSLESRIPPSTFPTGYPKLSGSLRSKPIGGVWQNSNLSNTQQPSPPSIPTREFINFHQDSPVRQVYHHPNPNRPFDPQAPLTKRPRLGQSNPPDDDSSFVRRDQADVGGRSSRLLDQHIYSQSVLDKHRVEAQDDHHHHHPSEPRAGNPQYDHHLGARSGNSTGATSSTLARQHSQLGLASPSANNNLNAPISKNKRTRISCGMADAEAEECSNPGTRLNATSQQPAAVGLKKRVRKSNPIGSSGKNADRLAPNLEDPVGDLARMTDQKAGGTFTAASPHANKASTIPFAGGTTRKTGAGGVRQTIGNPSKAADGAPVVTKRAYTKRSGLGNTATAAGGSKGKRGNGKKSGVGAGNEGGSSVETGKESGTRSKADQVVGERGRKGAGTKEGLRLEDVVEGGGGNGKGRGRKAGPTLGDIGTLSRRGGGGPAGENEEAGSHVGGDEWEDLVSQGMVLKGQSSKKGQDDEDGVDSADGGVQPSSESNHSSSAKAYCICRGEVYGDRMVACDNSECPIEWFHYQCAGLTEDPTGNWFCPDCQSKGFGCIT